MATDINALLLEKKIELPQPNAPRGSYVPFVREGSLVFIAGQGPRLGGELRFTGKVGRDLTIEQGQQAARICSLNILSHVRTACYGDLNKVARVVRLAGLVNCESDFTEHPTVLNGASDFLVDIFGEAGRHVRIATGANSLPFDMAVEVEAVFALK